jgi:hypothetical protein
MSKKALAKSCESPNMPDQRRWLTTATASPGTESADSAQLREPLAALISRPPKYFEVTSSPTTGLGEEW